MHTPLTPPAEAYIPDANRAGPEGLVRWLALLICVLLEPWNAVRLFRNSRPKYWWPDRRPDLPAGSTQAEAAAVRGAFGNAIAWMCRRRGIGPGHPDWPELSRAIVAFGGSHKGLDFGAPAWGLQWWENPNVVPGMVTGFGLPSAVTASPVQPQAVAGALSPAPSAIQAETARARVPAAWSPASWRQDFARAGPGPSTGPPGCPGLPTFIMSDARGRSMASPAVLIRAV
jgi:hypothetical protein